MATKAATAWGEATVIAEAAVPQEAGEKRFASVVQLLADADGRRYVRFAYTTGGTARRGPVTFREEDVEALRAAVREHPELTQLLGFASDPPRGGGRKRNPA